MEFTPMAPALGLQCSTICAMKTHTWGEVNYLLSSCITLTHERNETYLCGFYTRLLYWVSSQPSPRSNYSPSPPMKLMTSQSLPPSSASSVMIMSHSIDLAGLAQWKNSLTWHCFLTSNSNQSDKISPPYTNGFHTKQLSHSPTNRSGPGLSADT